MSVILETVNLRPGLIRNIWQKNERIEHGIVPHPGTDLALTSLCRVLYPWVSKNFEKQVNSMKTRNLLDTLFQFSKPINLDPFRGWTDIDPLHLMTAYRMPSESTHSPS